ncbi:MAG: D-2-hydroxyacid dehydrogenase [Cyclobacteriaceae bacterium]
MDTNIVVLEGFETNPGDLSWSPIADLGNFQLYDQTSQDQLTERITQANIIITNKLKIDESVLESVPNLKLICQLATGTDNIDSSAAKNHGVIVKNAPNYSTSAVAQHTFSLILELVNHICIHNTDVANHGWSKNGHWSYWLKPSFELEGKTLGIYGFGQIGKKVNEIAECFGMKTLICSEHGDPSLYPNSKFVELEELFSESDIVTLHKPLSDKNKEIIDSRLIDLMKPSAYLINTARGGLVNETDLRENLLNNKIAGAALDVLSQEPPEKNHPLLGIPNCIITPHIAWTPIETRKRLIEITAKNIKDYLNSQG